MDTYALKRRVGKDGILKIELPVGVFDTDVEIVVVVQPASKKGKSSKHERANESWSGEEEEQLLKLYRAGAPLVAISGKLKRSQGAVRSRLEKLGVITDK